MHHKAAPREARPTPLRRRPRRSWVTPLLLALAGVVWAIVAVIVTGAVVIFAGSYTGGDVRPEDVTAAHHGQLVLLLLAVIGGAPWLACWVRTKAWLAAGFGVVSAAIPLLALASHLSVRDWHAAFVF